MRILHCCLAQFYVDNYSYQENVLPRMHRLQGHTVAILASTETYIDNRVLGYVEPRSYQTNDAIPITRLAYARGIPHKLARKLRIYRGLYTAVDAFAPDVLFLHDCQFLSIRSIAAYARRHPNVAVYVDSHTDFMNSAGNWLSRTILHGVVYKHCARAIEPYTRKFYGVLPVRVDFYRTMYGIPAEKLELLVMGAEDTQFEWARRDEIRSSVREELGIREGDFVVVSGGKIDRRKNIHLLMQAVQEISQPDVKLLIFGTPNDDMQAEIDSLSEHDAIKYVGWVTSGRTYELFLASDLAVFPGTHSVLWEQAVGVGLPCVFRRWEGIEHVDVGGNCLFLDSTTPEDIKRVVLDLHQDRTLYSRLRQVAMDKGRSQFSYYEIAKRAIGG